MIYRPRANGRVDNTSASVTSLLLGCEGDATTPLYQFRGHIFELGADGHAITNRRMPKPRLPQCLLSP